MDTVTAAAYAGYNGFGQMPFSDMEALHKALTAGTGTDAAGFSGGRSLVVESLEQTLMTTTYSMEDIVLFRKLKSNPIFAVVDEWTSKDDYGARYGVAVGETENPGARDTSYQRHTATAKFYRVQREISHVMTLMKGIVDAEAEEQTDGTMLLVRALEEALFFGDSSIIPEEIDGIKRIVTSQGASDCVIDVRGPVGQQHFQEGARTIRGHFGVPTDAFLSLSNQTDVDRILESQMRVSLPVMGENGLMLGAPVESFRTSWGTFKLNPSVFITEEKAPLAAPTTAAAPAAPTSVTAAAAGTGSQFLTADAGTYFYQASYFTKSGESAGVAIGSAVTVASGQQVTLTINGGNTTTVSGVKIFRSKLNAAAATDTLLIGTVAFTGSGMTFVDTNASLPGSSSIFLCNMSPNYRAIEWRQLLPLMKLPLAITGPSMPFLLMLYGYLRITKPSQFCVLKNCRPSDHRFAN